MLYSESAEVVRNSRGEFVLTDDVSGEIRVFRAGGEFQETIGRRGEGPGEFEFISAASFDAQDSLWVLDSGLGRVSVFSPTYELVRTWPLALQANFDGAFTDAGWVVNGNLRTPAAVGHPLHLVVDSIGMLSFGSDVAVYRPDIPYYLRRAVGGGDSSSVWSGWLNQYVVERWEVSGGMRLDLVVRRDEEWFEPYWTPIPYDADTPPSPLISDVQQQGNLLWVLLRVPDPEWQSANYDISEDRTRFKVTDPHDRYDAIVEVIDLVNGTLLSSLRVDERLYGFAAPGFVYGPDTDAAGNPLIDTWAVEITNSRK